MQHNEQTENMALLYAYGELESALQGAFEKHLTGCKECQAVLRACALTYAAQPAAAAPKIVFAPAQAGQKTPPWYKGLFTFKKLVPAGVLAAVLIIVSAGALKFSGPQAQYLYLQEDLYTEITDIEAMLDDMDDYWPY
ncbi:MAG: zf-HC2 domain-containing protein [Elusimicrobiota bacterium]|jgi:anti-sigma factor RsiW|nr:zf-HC2 domain-containing protein [Elusimicrobiota bacterium]